MTLKDSLCAVELFCELPDDLAEEVIARGSTVSVAPGVPVVNQGDRGAGMVMLIEGTADVVVDGRVVGSLSTGDYFGEMSLIDGSGRTATVMSGPDGLRAFRLSPTAFTSLIDQHPHVAMLLLKGLVARVRRLEAQDTGPAGG
ncbi:cyclic nucleotide-binding protein [Humibacillus xanthopallidus]|uniref:Cyclic nucleotide-binding protein n=1 Tax=Humibacillus xanthopallidus TaxID=412689 RepID=A0A543PKW6_9MICO|nr:cyclic nucleotide-binding domain-containing protein [Humibacillus xanthopallidus]TQN44713.1 cyclic nucleotide-binding protein [Humibacillus xanthopallidus]